LLLETRRAYGHCFLRRWRLGALLLTVMATVPCLHGATNAWYPAEGVNWGGWPSTWTAIPSLNDPKDLTDANARLDFVGDAQNPCGYWAANSNYFFVRMRVAVSNVTATTFRDSHWVYVDRIDFTNGSAAKGLPDYAFAWDSKNADITKHGLELNTGSNQTATTWSTLALDDIDGSTGGKVAPPDFNLSGDGYIRTVDQVPTANFGYTTFIDIAVKWSFLSASTALASNQQWRIQFGSRNDSTDHNAPTDDIAGGFAPTNAITNSYSAVILVAPSVPLAASLQIQAFAAAEGTVVEFASTGETGNQDMILSLWVDGAWQEVGRQPSSGEGDHVYRFVVPGLQAGDCCSLRVRDDAGQYHVVSGLPVTTFAARAVQMDLDGLWLEWEAMPDCTYDIYRADRLGGAWSLVKTLTAVERHPRTFIAREGGAAAGFYKIVLR
jgi:hypothetical protein